MNALDPMLLVAEAERLLAMGDLGGAARAAQGVLGGQPAVGLALHVLGQVAARQGDGAGAMAVWESACRAAPGVPQPWAAMGEAHFRLGQMDRAVECLREALARGPGLHEVRINYGIVLQNAGRHEEAVDQLRLGLTGMPENAEGITALATSLHHLGRTGQAIAVLREAVERDGGNIKFWTNLGVLYDKAGRLEEALPCYSRAAALGPRDAQALFNRGSCLIQMLRLDEARRDWEAALGITPGDALIQNNLAILELLDGNLPKGFELFEARWAVRHKKFPIPAPEWDGSSLAGRHVLLYVEQGLGDMLQFCRYVPVLKRMYGCRITLAALPTLHGLLRSLEGADAVVGIHPPYPPADVQCSLLSVPRVLRTTLATVPAEVPYLRAEAGRVGWWRDRLASLGVRGEGLKVGLFWQGTQVDPNRIIRLAELRPLWEARPEAQFVSLQKGRGEEEIGSGEAADLPMVAVGHELLDFSDTAAVLAGLDVVISIDTALAHAAGALGRPTWVLLPKRPDWRWLLGRSDCPWYPGMRLFRQSERGRWGSVIEAVAGQLKRWE